MLKVSRDLKTSLLDWLLLVLILPGILSGLILAVRRYEIENRNRKVELALDYSELQDLSAASGTSIMTLLEQFRSVGVTGIAINEEVLSDLTSEGRVSLYQKGTYAEPITVVRVTDPQIAGRVFRAISSRMPQGMVVPDLSQIDPSRTIGIPYEIQVYTAPQTITRLGIGLPPDAVQMIQNAGLDVIARIGNRPSITRKSISATILDLKQQNIIRIICSGEEIIGFRGLIQHTANAIKSAGLLYGSVEFAKQRGDTNLSLALGSSLVRVHSIPSSEMAEMTLREAVDRFVRAVKERNIRLCYIHLVETTGEDPIKKNTEFVAAISSGIRSLGYTTGAAEPFGQVLRPNPMLATEEHRER